MVSDGSIEPGNKGFLIVFIIRICTNVVVLECLRVLIEMRECLNDLRIVVVILIRGRIEGSLDLKLLVSLGLKRGTYLKFLNIRIL